LPEIPARSIIFKSRETSDLGRTHIGQVGEAMWVDEEGDDDSSF
jgi:hypothetical protein